MAATRMAGAPNCGIGDAEVAGANVTATSAQLRGEPRENCAVEGLAGATASSSTIPPLAASSEYPCPAEAEVVNLPWLLGRSNVAITSEPGGTKKGETVTSGVVELPEPSWMSSPISRVIS